MTTGEAIRLLRRRAGLTQKDAAKKLGVTSVQLSYVERGRRTLTMRTVENVRAAFGFCPLLLSRLSDPAINLEKHRTVLIDAEASEMVGRLIMRVLRNAAEDTKCGN